jgi:hypothetical protein
MRYGRAVLQSTLLLATLVASGCTQEMRRDLGDVRELSGEMADAFGSAPNVGIMNGNVLTVTFLNSGRETLADAEREAAARQTAEFVRDHYDGYSRLQEVRIVFSSNRSVGPASIGRSHSHAFPVADLGASTAVPK